ncbi:hypothetical protein FQV26_13535 [Planococcus sp. CPCC 101016]|uniref:hypothetical protein n=1 Tax=Planococcus sp. CPCC 101016 TaxID=2599617 RepID=UPI0011B4539D|nr:hypothetical protein [Planococcus sp. CPCC 101016]TWT05450.1 hypothetical protein FQV26_13535 [Planococcus sp. CPCC 101016]
MTKRVKNTILGTLIFGVIGFVVTYILDGAPVWNLVIGQALGGFLLYAFILPTMETRNKRKKGDIYE